MLNFFKRSALNTDTFVFDDADKEILLYVYNKVKLESETTVTFHQLYRVINVDSQVLISSKINRLVLDGYLIKTIDTKDIRFTYLNITNLGIETLKKLRLINIVIENS